MRSSGIRKTEAEQMTIRLDALFGIDASARLAVRHELRQEFARPWLEEIAIRPGSAGGSGAVRAKFLGGAGSLRRDQAENSNRSVGHRPTWTAANHPTGLTPTSRATTFPAIVSVSGISRLLEFSLDLAA